MDDSRFADLLTQFSRKSILVLGDVMLDRFIWGNVSRISPEAPVPVVHVQRESAYPGGAANVARNLLPFAGQVHVMGVLGPGMMGDLLRKNFEEEGLATDALVNRAPSPHAGTHRLSRRPFRPRPANADWPGCR